MDEAIIIAIRAEEASKAAHQRLDRMNGSIDRLANEVAKANAKGEEILVRLARDDGEDEGHSKASKGFLESKRFLITTIGVIATSSVATGILPFVFRSHS